MTTELAVINEDGEVIESTPRAPMTLFGTDDPKAVVERASAVATALASVIDERRLFASISGKKHVQVEGWTLLGSMLGVFAEVAWSRPLENGWEARAVARTLAGNVVGAAEAMCTASEGRWRNADTYAIRSMAQTRAVSKALRLPLGFIMHLAGYSATPAEELADEQPDRSERASASGGARALSAKTSDPAPRTKGEALALIADAAKANGLTFRHIEEHAKALGIDRGEASIEDLMRLWGAIVQPAPDVAGVGAAPVARGGDGSSDLPAATHTPSEVGEPVSATEQSEVDSPQPSAAPAQEKLPV